MESFLNYIVSESYLHLDITLLKVQLSYIVLQSIRAVLRYKILFMSISIKLIQRKKFKSLPVPIPFPLPQNKMKTN